MNQMQECYKAFLDHYPWLIRDYPEFNIWLFSSDDICVSFRKGWSSCNDYRNR